MNRAEEIAAIERHIRRRGVKRLPPATLEFMQDRAIEQALEPGGIGAMINLDRVRRRRPRKRPS